MEYGHLENVSCPSRILTLAKTHPGHILDILEPYQIFTKQKIACRSHVVLKYNWTITCWTPRSHMFLKNMEKGLFDM